MIYDNTYLSVRGMIYILVVSPKIVVFHQMIEIVGEYLPSLLEESCLLRIFNQRTRKVLNLWLMNMRIDLILRSPRPKGLDGVILLLFRVRYLEGKGRDYEP